MKVCVLRSRGGRRGEPWEGPCAHRPVALAVCDSCVLLLLEDLQSVEMSFPSIRSQLVNLSASSIAWARLHALNRTMATVAVRGGLASLSARVSQPVGLISALFVPEPAA